MGIGLSRLSEKISPLFLPSPPEGERGREESGEGEEVFKDGTGENGRGQAVL
jgi:hypothetical protein